MPKNKTPMNIKDEREGGRVAGELAAQRLFDLIADRFEELVECEGLTQAQLALRIGVSEQQLSFWLNKTRNMTIKSAGRLLHGLHAHLLFEADYYESIETCSNAHADSILYKAPNIQFITARNAIKQKIHIDQDSVLTAVELESQSQLADASVNQYAQRASRVVDLGPSHPGPLDIEQLEKSFVPINSNLSPREVKIIISKERYRHATN